MKRLLTIWYWCQQKVRAVLPAISGFLPRVVPGRKHNTRFLKRVFLLLAAVFLMCPGIVHGGGGARNTLPSFTYTGSYILLDDDNGDWRIKFLTSGTLRFQKLNGNIQVFLVGGGGSGASTAGGGGAGGFAVTQLISAEVNVDYPIVIGAGGAGKATGTSANGNAGGNTSAFGVTANGGAGGLTYSAGSSGGSGGSGGGKGTTGSGYAGGSDGSNGSGNSAGIGTGQGTSTREFGVLDGDLYAGAGGGGGGSAGDGGTGGAGGGTNGGKAAASTSCAANTGAGSGGGGAGAAAYGSGNGGSGICVVRNLRAA